MSETNGKFKEIGVLRDVEKYLEAQKMLSSSLQSATLHLMKAKRKNLRGVPDVENIRTEIDPTFVEQVRRAGVERMRYGYPLPRRGGYFHL
jgi:hypothetical protein